VRRGNYAWLILALMLLMVWIPLADEIATISRPFARAVAFSCLLGIGMLSLKGSRRFYFLLVTIAVSGIVLNIVAARWPYDVAVFGSFVAIMTFLLLAIVVTFRDVATDPEISANRIVGAVAVYLLLGVLWAVSYTIVDSIWPGSFTGFVPGMKSEWDSEWLYYSFVTMTTLGYGDIAPVSPVARLLAYLQAIFGQLYIAILVAGLVSAYISRKDRERT